ncbi:hypothetical protein QFI66_007300 [Raoultella sp. BAC10a-01-01]|uniref:Uncharacterized protein n=1 Tax=Raoultella scottii TaxID=3040937 RepID=A0ABU8Z3T3_9ENTR
MRLCIAVQYFMPDGSLSDDVCKGVDFYGAQRAWQGVRWRRQGEQR